MSLCPPIPKGGYANFGETLVKLDEVIGMYKDCRVRHGALVEYETKKVK
jgi:hypothetical protein